MVGPCYRFRTLVLLVALAASSACGNNAATLSDVAGVETLQQRFNADAGKPRIVLLLSPT
jgi:hypothetical protein